MWTIICLTILVIINVIGYVFFASRFKQLQIKQHDELTALRKEFRIMSGSMSEVGCHLVDIERQLSDVGEKQTEIAVQAIGEEGLAADYDQAKRLIEMGAEVEEVIASCGLTRAEAELLERVRT